MSDESQEPVESQKPDEQKTPDPTKPDESRTPDEAKKPDEAPVPENAAQSQPPESPPPSPPAETPQSETPKSDGPPVWFEPELPPLRGPEIPGAPINEHGVYRVPDRDRDLLETAVVDGFLGLGMDEEPIEWLWPGYLPIGTLTLIEGESASGKSFLAADIAARVSRGQPWPGRIQGPQLAHEVLYVSFEDNRETILAPRLRRSGADLSRVRFLSAISTFDGTKEKKGESVSHRRPVFDKDLVHLEFNIRRNGNVRLVVIDSLPTLCPDRKSYRETLRRLEEIARRRGVAILATARPSTRSRGRPKVAGDKLSEEVRCLFNLLPDPEDPQQQRRLLAPVRMNFCEEPEWLAFRIVDGRVAWETPTDDESLSSCVENPIQQKAAVLHEVMGWLGDGLKDEDQHASAMLRQARECGYSKATLRRACIKMKVRHIRCDYGPMGFWMWTLRPEPPVEEAVPATGGAPAKRSRSRPVRRGSPDPAESATEGLPVLRRPSVSACGSVGDRPQPSGDRPQPKAPRSRPAKAPGQSKSRLRALLEESAADGPESNEPPPATGKARKGGKRSRNGDHLSNGNGSSNGSPRKPR